MQIKVSKKHIWICLLLCSLFLASNISVLNINGIISSDVNVFDSSSVGGESERSSMNSEDNYSHFDYISTTDSSVNFSIFSLKQSRCPLTKTNLNILTAMIAAQIICFIYSSRLSDKTCTQFNSIRITLFLHKKDGMK